MFFRYKSGFVFQNVLISALALDGYAPSTIFKNMISNIGYNKYNTRQPFF